MNNNTPEPPSGEAIIALSREKKLVSQPMFIMRTFPGPLGMGPVLENLQTHLDYWAEMEEQKVMFVGGPIMPPDLQEPWSGEGMVILRAESLEAARKIVEDDPIHKSKARSYELMPFLLNHLVT